MQLVQVLRQEFYVLRSWLFFDCVSFVCVLSRLPVANSLILDNQELMDIFKTLVKHENVIWVVVLESSLFIHVVWWCRDKIMWIHCCCISSLVKYQNQKDIMICFCTKSCHALVHSLFLMYAYIWGNIFLRKNSFCQLACKCSVFRLCVSPFIGYGKISRIFS